jgi:hypothetical protein
VVVVPPVIDVVPPLIVTVPPVIVPIPPIDPCLAVWQTSWDLFVTQTGVGGSTKTESPFVTVTDGTNFHICATIVAVPVDGLP